MKTVTFASALVAALAIVPLAAAQDAPDEGEPAWVDDCPPDMMCAFGAPSDDAPRDADAEAEPPTTRGPDDCEYCRGPADDEGTPAWMEDCPDEMMCIASSEGGPSPPAVGTDDAPRSGADGASPGGASARVVPGAGLASVAVAVLAVALVGRGGR